MLDVLHERPRAVDRDDARQPAARRRHVDEIAALSIGDFWGPNSAKYCAAAIAGAAWLYYTEGNMLLLGMVYMLYRRTQTPAPGAVPVGTGVPPQ